MDLGCQSDIDPFQQMNDCGALTTNYIVSPHWKIAGANDLSDKQEWNFVWMKACQPIMDKDAIAELPLCRPRKKILLK
jgi:hypothetical protein